METIYLKDSSRNMIYHILLMELPSWHGCSHCLWSHIWILVDLWKRCLSAGENLVIVWSGCLRKIEREFIKQELENSRDYQLMVETTLYDGQLRCLYENPVLVGVGYILENLSTWSKISSIQDGPYSLVTGNPLEESQNGRTRIWKMEVWALK